MTEQERPVSDEYDPVKEFETDKEALFKYVRGLEFGTSAYEASCDQLMWVVLYEDIVGQRELIDRPVPWTKGIQVSSTILKSILRISEQKMALLDLQIHNRNGKMRRYRQAGATFMELQANVGESLAILLGKTNPEDSDEEQISIAQYQKNEIFKDIQKILDEKAQ